MGIGISSIGNTIKGLNKEIKYAPNFVKKVVNTAKKSRTPMLLGAGIGLYLGYKIADYFTNKSNSGIIPEKEPRCNVKPRGIITDKKPLTIKDLIDEYIKNQNKTKLDRLKDFIVIILPRPNNPAQNPFINHGKYEDFVKQLAEIQQNGKNYDLKRIPENLTEKERMDYIQEHGGPGLKYEC